MGGKSGNGVVERVVCEIDLSRRREAEKGSVASCIRSSVL